MSVETVSSASAAPNNALTDSLMGNMASIQSRNRDGGTDYSQMNRDAYAKTLTFVRSPFAHTKGVVLERRYKDVNG